MLASRVMSKAALGVVELGNEITCQCSFVAEDAVHVHLQWRNQTLFDAVLKPDRPEQTKRLESHLVRSKSTVEIDFFSGELSWTARILIKDAQRPITVETDRDVFLRFDPCIGQIKGEFTAIPPVVDHPEWGRSGMSSTTVTRIHIDDHDRQVAGVGRLVKKELFADYAPFTFNTVACCGEARQGQPGVYGDPESHWFNVFFGIYQLDCRKIDGWERPFGYDLGAGLASTPRCEDLVRLGKSDWNWFSNFMYGVPASACVDYSAVDMDAVTIVAPETIKIGESMWHHLTIDGIEVVSCYEADVPGADKLVQNSILSPAWEASFGLPCPRPEYPVSFIPTTLIATFYMAYWEDDLSYHTVVFGGTSGAQANLAFLQAQLQSITSLIEQSYPLTGFEIPA